METHASAQAVVIAEYRLLNAIIRNKDLRNDPRLIDELFVDDVAKTIFDIINDLNKKEVEITPASLLQAVSNTDGSINQGVVQTIFDIETSTVNTLDDILGPLEQAKLKNNLLEKIESIKDVLNQPGDLNKDIVSKTLYEVEDTISEGTKGNSILLDFDKWADLYIEDLQQRKEGRKYSFGDPLLDEALFRGAAPGGITTVVSSTNMGKSTYVLSLMDNLLDHNSPCLYISLEMGKIDTMDRLIQKRCGVEGHDLYDKDSIDGIIELVEKQKEELAGRKKWYFCEASNCDLNKLRALIREFKQRTHSDYAVVAIDLLSGLKNFMSASNGSSTASTIENNMNRLEDLAKEENIHILGVVQLNRNTDAGKLLDISDIDRFRPSLGDIKNSAAFAEKSTTVLALFRPKYYVDRYFPDQTDQVEDIMEVQILKDRNAQAGKILKYMFDGRYFKLIPLTEEELAEREKLNNLDLDF